MGDSPRVIPRAHPAFGGRLPLAPLLLLLLSFSGQAGEWNLDRLMAGLAQNPGGRVDFTEKTYMSILDLPVEGSGELVYIPPDRLEKRTVEPRAELASLQGGELTLERGGQRRTLRLDEYPEAAAFVESIRGTLAGDRAALERTYRLRLEGGEDDWTLVLEPRGLRLSAVVRRIEIRGGGAEVRRIEILQPDGDRSVMELGPPQGPWTPP
jgi:hypothetical protein